MFDRFDASDARQRQKYWLSRVVSLYQQGAACLPAAMGLPLDAYQALLAGLYLPDTAPVTAQQEVLSLLYQSRSEEQQQLQHWLSHYVEPDAQPMEAILASACLGFNHLWQDLGLASRAELRELMQDCFPQLVAMNSGNMRWKKFFYRQRCLAEVGEVVCRSPSCDDCYERGLCFSPVE
jgi:nitrogen fixation protein NifQ